MISGFGIKNDEWKRTPRSVCIAAAALQHQLFILNARLTVYQQQNSELKTKLEHLERNKAEQKVEIERLKLKVVELKERLGQNSANSSLPPSSDSPFSQLPPKRKTAERKQGAQPGHLGAGRRLLPEAEIDQVVDFQPDRCSACGVLLLGNDSAPARRQVVELVNGQIFVKEYRRHRLQCLSCRALNRAEWPSQVVGASTFGASVSAVVAYLTGRLNLSQRDTVEALSELFNLKIALGSVSALQQRVSQALAEPVAQAFKFVQQQSSQCVDETGWPVKSQLNWLWVNSAENVTVFSIRDGRSRADAQKVIDEDESGVITTDRYPAYNFLQPWRRQICWAHLKRDFVAMSERDDAESKDIGAQLLVETKKLFELFAKVRDGTIQHYHLRPQMKEIKARVKELLETGSAVANQKTAGVCRRIRKVYRSLWTFVRVAAVEPTNNRAERALRRAVLWRKKSFGTQSQAGSRFVERILTVIATLGQQRRSVLEFLTNVCTALANRQKADDFPLDFSIIKSS